MAFYAIAVVFSLLGLSIVWSQGRTLPIAIGAVFVLAIVALRYFHQVGTWQDLLRKARRTLSRRDQVRYALLQAQVLELELERCTTSHEFWKVFEITMRRVGFTERGEAETEVTVSVKHNGSTPWTLYAPRNRGSAREWQRLAECFRPVYSRAQAKWQTN